MATGVQAYRFNDSTFAFETFDDEVVVLNLIDGIYYAFGGAAIVAWPHLVAQHSELAVASALAAKYGIPVDRLGDELNVFVRGLVSEQILLTAPENTSPIDPSRLGSLPEYEGFSFERHTDMEDLLTLDPIHDVDPQKGWPET